jgi:hypothetical protein
VYDLSQDVNAERDEVVEQIVSGYSINLARTSRRLLFFGNNSQFQLPPNAFDTSGFLFLNAFELKADRFARGKQFSDVKQIATNFDRVSVVFNDYTAVVLNKEEEKEREMIDQLEVEILEVGRNNEIVYGREISKEDKI